MTYFFVLLYLVKLLIVCLSLIGFSLLLMGLKCLNNNVHIPSNLIYNRMIASTLFLPVDTTNDIERLEPNDLDITTTIPFDTSITNLHQNTKNSKSEAHHLFECALFKYKIKNSELFLLLVYFMCFFITTLTLITCLISEGFTQNMDIIFHIISFLLYFCTSIFVLVEGKYIF